MGITLTEKAANEVVRAKEEQKWEPEAFLRIAVGAGGCSGYGYKLGFDTNFDDTIDTKYEFFGLSVVVDKKSMLLLDGTLIDYKESIDQRGFSFENPNAVKSCGCGSSFQA